MDNRTNKLKELVKDEAFMKELFSKNNNEDARAFLLKNGLDMTAEEIDQLTEIMKKLKSGELTTEEIEKNASVELTPDELEQAAGGDLICACIVVGGFGLILVTGAKNLGLF